MGHMMEIRPLVADDAVTIATEFAALGWPGKTVDQYRRYLDEQESGVRAVHVAFVDGAFAGYLTVCWDSFYTPFRDAGTPEITDLNVLPAFRRRGIASALMDVAEDLIAVRSAVGGIGVGLYAAYAAAHLMYLRRGYLPDGRGIAYRGMPSEPGAAVRVDDELALMMVRRLR
jgi:GNAT superfamily N-acetyltransferase